MATAIDDLDELVQQTRLLDLAILGLRFLATTSVLTPAHLDAVSEAASAVQQRVEKLLAANGADVKATE